jgi:hypothetical protein
MFPVPKQCLASVGRWYPPAFYFVFQVIHWHFFPVIPVAWHAAPQPGSPGGRFAPGHFEAVAFNK